MDSVLTSVKKLLGIEENYTHFDSDVIMHINTALMTLDQMGVLDKKTSIDDSTTKWSDLVTDTEKFSAIKSYIHLKVRLLFDPPSSSFVIESIKDQIEELEWRLRTRREFE